MYAPVDVYKMFIAPLLAIEKKGATKRNVHQKINKDFINKMRPIHTTGYIINSEKIA